MHSQPSKLGSNDPENQYGAITSEGYEIIGNFSAVGANSYQGLKQKISELQQMAERGEWTMRLAGCIAGAIISLISAMSIMSDFLKLSPFTAILDIYLSAFGLLTLLLEYKESTFPSGWLQVIKREAHFLYQPYGRAGFYFFIGVVLIVKGGLLRYFILIIQK